ncbi:hypothetical protein EG68_01415, partial [Paragonimus skrjabini miyazakii]
MIAKIVKEDLLSSLTGGFYFDSAETHLTNLVHLYTWIIFFISPLVAYLVHSDTCLTWLIFQLAPDSYICGTLYGSFIVLFTTLIKFMVWRLHRILDTEEPILVKPHDSGTSNQLIGKVRVSASIGPHEPSLADHVTAPEHISRMHDVEERCRRVGQAGLDMAGKFLSAIVLLDFYLMEALQNNQSIVPRQLPVSSFSNRPRTGTSFADHPDVPAINLENSDVSSRALNNSAVSENFHPEVSGRSSNCDKAVGTLIHEQALTVDTNLCTDQLEAKIAVCFKNVLIDKDSESPSTTVTPVPHSSPATIRKPVHRQLSWVAANSFPEADHGLHSIIGQNEAKFSHSPSTSRSLYRRRSCYSGVTDLRFQLPGMSDHANTTIPPVPYSVDLVRADMERCRLAIQQMKLDVHRLRVRPRTKLALSHKNFESVDLYPKRRNLSVGRPRSSSQRYHRSIWTSNFHASHRQSSTLAYFPPSLFPRPLNHPTDITEFNLADAVLFWRRHFAGAEDTSRTVRTQSLRRPIQHTLSFKCCDRI